jgi:hypothetical protein
VLRDHNVFYKNTLPKRRHYGETMIDARSYLKDLNNRDAILPYLSHNPVLKSQYDICSSLLEKKAALETRLTELRQALGVRAERPKPVAAEKPKRSLQDLKLLQATSVLLPRSSAGQATKGSGLAMKGIRNVKSYSSKISRARPASAKNIIGKG